jgi:hypothetical protein
MLDVSAALAKAIHRMKRSPTDVLLMFHHESLADT